MPKKSHCQNFLHTVQHLKANKAQIPQKQLFSLYKSDSLSPSLLCTVQDKTFYKKI